MGILLALERKTGQRRVVLAYEIPFLFFSNGIVRSDVMNDIFEYLTRCTLIIKQVLPKYSDSYIGRPIYNATRNSEHHTQKKKRNKGEKTAAVCSYITREHITITHDSYKCVVVRGRCLLRDKKRNAVFHRTACVYCRTLLHAFANEYPEVGTPTNSTISRLITKFRETGSCTDKRKELEPIVCTPENKALVLASVQNNPRLSTEKWAPAVHILRTSMQQILHTLNLKPYHLQMVQELKPPNLPLHLRFCRWLLHLSHRRNNIAVFDNFFFSDEAWFHLDGFINSQNYCIWTAD